MPAIDRIALAEVRLLKEAQKGNPKALRELIEPYLSGIWSISRGHLPDDQAALESVARFRDTLVAELRAFAHDRPFGLQLYAALWRHLSAGLEPVGDTSIPSPASPLSGRALRPRGDDVRIVHEVLSMSAPLTRLIYLFWVVTDLDAIRVSELIGVSERLVRRARAVLTVRIQEALSQ